jgi:hypothetical protein
MEYHLQHWILGKKFMHVECYNLIWRQKFLEEFSNEPCDYAWDKSTTSFWIFYFVFGKKTHIPIINMWWSATPLVNGETFEFML